MADGARDGSIGFIDVPSAPRVLAADLRERIAAGSIPEGVTLPTEAELVKQTQLNRAHVRAALSILETEGFVEQRGNRWRARLPAADTVAAAVALTLQSQHIDGIRLLELRQAIEPESAALAARYRTPDDLALIARAAARLERAADAADVPDYVVASREWHISIAAATHDPVLLGVFTPIAHAIVRAEDDTNIGRSNMLDTAAVHRGVVEAIEAGDAGLARARMAQHVGRDDTSEPV